MFPIKRTVFFTSVTVHENTVRVIGNIEYLTGQTETKSLDKLVKISDEYVTTVFIFSI